MADVCLFVSPTPKAMIDLHHDIFFFLISVVTLTFYMMFQVGWYGGGLRWALVGH